MRQTNKLFLLLALLLTAATGAWADVDAPNTKTFTVPDTWQNVFEAYTAADLPADFAACSDDEAAAWAAACTDEFAVLIYSIGNVYTKSNVASKDSRQKWQLHQAQLMGYKIYYTASAATTYTVSLADGVKDADKWTITPNEGLKEGDQVTLQYSGRLKVKGVKATSDAAAPSVPDGALSGVFSVSDSKKVYFSKGNLRYASGAWSFFDNQYDYYADYSADAWDKFGWSTSATTYGMSTATSSSAYSGDFVDWGATMGTGWFTLSKDEWTYLFNTRSASTVNGTENGRYAKAKVNDVGGVILFPDTYTHPDGVTAPTGVNATNNTGWNGNSYTVADWTKMESAGCVFLPAAGYRGETTMDNLGTIGRYWSATLYSAIYTKCVHFAEGALNPAYDFTRYRGCSVRLVREVATSDAEEATPQQYSFTLTGPYSGTQLVVEFYEGDTWEDMVTKYSPTLHIDGDKYVGFSSEGSVRDPVTHKMVEKTDQLVPSRAYYVE